MSSSQPGGAERSEPEKKDALDEWVDELDRLIGIEPMSEEDMEEQKREQQVSRKGVDPVIVILIAITVLAAVALLFIFNVI